MKDSTWRLRAEQAEAEVVKLRAELAAAKANKYEEPMSKLVQVIDPKTGKPIVGQYKYEDTDEQT